MINMMRKILSVALTAMMTAALVPSVYAEDAQQVSEPEWRLQTSKYYSDELVVSGCTVKDYGAKGDGITDDTKAFADALDYMQKAGGGTVYVPEGKYVIRGSFVIPSGTALVGEIKTPKKGESAEGAIIMVYGGRGNVDADPCITMQPETGCRDLIFWYPEQSADNIVQYPPTILMGDSSVWGDEYCNVENIEFVNSYIGFKKASDMGGCPMIRNISGTPLKAGIIIDALADVGRVEHCDFSPVYWEKSGLPNSPDKTGAHRDFLYNNGIGVEMHRNDWSYGRYLSAEGYYAGFYALNSYCVEAYLADERIKDQYPNGENYGLSYNDCYIGVAIEGTANAGIVFTNVEIKDCEIGLYLQGSFDSKMNALGWTIDADKYSILHEGSGMFMCNGMSVERGAVKISSGYASILDSDFNNAAPQITYGQYSGGSVIGNRFKETAQIVNNSSNTVVIDHTAVDIEQLPDFPEINVEEKKPAKAVMYNVKDYGAKADNNTDDAPAVQKALDAAASNGGGLVFMPSGFYAFKSEITVPSGVELRGALDTPQVPVKYGSTIEVYAGKGSEGGKALITLSKDAIIRGICFDYPEQDYSNPIAYPYTIAGAGANVSAVNIGFRNAYQFMDLASAKCDNAYIEYMGGHTWRRGIVVGGGSENCKIMNTQMNYNTITSGAESKWGSWTNSPPKGSSDEEKAAWQIEADDIEGYMKKNFECFILGDTKNIIFYNNFIFPGGAGLTLKEENGRGPSGKSLGYGSDNSRIAFLIENIGDEGFDFINTQLVGVTSHDLVPIGIKTEKSFDKKLTLFGVAIWGNLDRFTELDGSGSIEIQDGNFASSIDRDFVINAGELSVVNSKINTYKQRLIDKNGGNASFIACNYLKAGDAEKPNEGIFKQYTANIDTSTQTYRKVRESEVKEFILFETVKVNAAGGRITFNETAPFIQNSTVYVPLKNVLSKFGYPVQYDNEKNQLTVTSSDKDMSITAGQTKAQVDGKTVQLEYPAKIVNGTMVVPASFIADALNTQISWSYKNRTLDISLPELPDTPRNSEAETVKLNIYSVMASSAQSGNEAPNLIDGSMSTRWAAEGDNYAIFDLGANRIVDSLKIAFNSGESRIYPFKVEISEDGKTWTQIITSENSGTTQDFEEYAVEDNGYGRYIKYSGSGSNVNNWNNIWEIEVYGK